MAEKATSLDKSLKSPTGAESPTTARELDFDDEQEPTTSDSHAQAPATKTVTFQDEAPPPKPPRPMDPQKQAEATLKEAFPALDEKVIRAVLVASGGQVEPAFNALLSMSDPNFTAEETPPPQPPRPTATARSQLEQDELYARQLAQHYQTQAAYDGYGSRQGGDPQQQRRRQETGLNPNEPYDDRERSFFDDDLPIIKQNIQKGFFETQTKVNKWIQDFKKKIDGEDEEDDVTTRPSGSNQRQNFGPSQSQQLYGIRKSAELRRQSGDRERYDADPRVLGDDFTALELHDNELPPEKPPRRPLANPDLFKPTPAAPQSSSVDEGDSLYRQPTPTNQQRPGEAGKTKKWQPLSSVAPNPEPDDHDPFSLGDSDDEDTKTKDVKAGDSDKSKKAAEPSDKPSDVKLEPAEVSASASSKDKSTEDLVAGKESKP